MGVAVNATQRNGPVAIGRKVALTLFLPVLARRGRWASGRRHPPHRRKRERGSSRSRHTWVADTPELPATGVRVRFYSCTFRLFVHLSTGDWLVAVQLVWNSGMKMSKFSGFIACLPAYGKCIVCLATCVAPSHWPRPIRVGFVSGRNMLRISYSLCLISHCRTVYR